MKDFYDYIPILFNNWLMWIPLAFIIFLSVILIMATWQVKNQKDGDR
tara:strand:+ start:204 stop:344 length:141 start_codon:yes stop_codon:yes gene_type:complete